ncbi:MAG TPA: patatin-like phospholipase family protein [Stellaceae bacterium]|nr:patatin-like phospholipase family protein [Stellaceae bacterium]
MARLSGKTAFVFTGGGSLGAIQVGMLRALLSCGVQPDFVVGASVGAINASYFAGAPDMDGVAMLERIWSGLRRSDIFPFTVASAFGLIRHPGNIVDPSRLRRVIEQNLPYAKLEDTHVPLNIMATNQQGLGVRLSAGPAVEAILASTAIPGIFPTVEIGGEALMDGAVAANTPVRLAVELGASRVIILSTGYACALKEPPRRAIAKALHAITLMINWQLIHELERMPGDVEVHLVPTLCPLAVSPFDFTASQALVERAARSSQKWIDEGGLERRALPQELAPHRHGRAPSSLGVSPLTAG